MSFSDSEGVEVSRGVVVVMLCWTGGDAVLPFEVPSIFGWMMFSTSAALNSGKPALET